MLWLGTLKTVDDLKKDMVNKKPPTKEESEYMGKVADLGCYIGNHYQEHKKDCSYKIEVHHKTGCGMALRASHYLTIGLCVNHHSAQTPLPFGYAVHKGTKSFEALYTTQDNMIEWSKQKIEGIE